MRHASRVNWLDKLLPHQMEHLEVKLGHRRLRDPRLFAWYAGIGKGGREIALHHRFRPARQMAPIKNTMGQPATGKGQPHYQQTQPPASPNLSHL
jgi:hypothetical protein